MGFGRIPSETLRALKQDIFFRLVFPVFIVYEGLFPALIVNQNRHAHFPYIIAPGRPSPHSEGSDQKGHLTLKNFADLYPRKGVVEQVQVCSNFMLLLFSDMNIERGRLEFSSNSNTTEVVTLNFKGVRNSF